jgi:hypothetical protein
MNNNNRTVDIPLSSLNDNPDSDEEEEEEEEEQSPPPSTEEQIDPVS